MKTIDILSLARSNIKQLKAYASARDDFKGAASIYLDANENPFPADFNRYPDPHQRKLKEAIAKLKTVGPDSIFLGNGSDEIIDLLIRVFCEPGRDHALIPQPTYGMYALCAEINDVKALTPTLTSTYDLDAFALLAHITPITKIIFLCSPNNPSGNLLNPMELEVILNDFNGLVVIDEAYIDFTESESWVTRLSHFQNLIVLQTFSKAWGLAGLRLGICYADPSIIKLLDKIKPPYNINAFTQSEVQRVIETTQPEKHQWVGAIKVQRETLRNKLADIPCVKNIFPSDANFLLVEMTDAQLIYDKLVKKGIIVRDRSTVAQCDNCLRITVGTDAENAQLIKTLRLL